MTFQLLNEKKMFASFETNAIMTVRAWKVLKDKMLEYQDILTLQEKSAWNEVWAIVATLPRQKMHLSGKVGDFNTPVLYGHPDNKCAYGNDLCTVIVNPKRFVSRAQNNDNVPSDIQKWGLDAASGLIPYIRMIEKFIATHNLPITFTSSVAKRASDIKKRLETGDYLIQAYDPIANLAEVEACVVFIAGKTGGYLNNRGGWGPLGGARLFESSGAAYTTIRSQGISSAAVVHIGTQVLRVDEKSSLDGDFQNLQEAMSIVERKRIQQALDDATHEQLLERLAHFEQANEIQAPIKKKKM